jgi:hypothetical protein
MGGFWSSWVASPNDVGNKVRVALKLHPVFFSVSHMLYGVLAFDETRGPPVKGYWCEES